MRSWLRGKGIGMAVFLVVAGLVAGGLGWVTLVALQQERDQLEFRTEANAWLALWRLDSRIFTDLAKEANLPYHEFRLDVVSEEKDGETPPDLALVEMTPPGTAENLPWVQRRLLVVRKADWKSTQRLVSDWRQGLSPRDPKTPLPPAASGQPALLAGLSRNAALHQLLTQAAVPMTLPGAIPAGEIANQVVQQPNFLPNDNAGQQSGLQQQAGRDAMLRYNRAQMEINQQALSNLGPGADHQKLPINPRPVLTIRGPLLPMWITPGADRKLVITRLIQVGETPACVVTLLDWPVLRRLLAEEVRDLLPHAHLEPLREGTAPNPDRTMTALPVELDPGPLSAEEIGKNLNPLRVGLILAWSAAFVALLAVGLGGWSLLNLSERRIRFVSAVTHELRTPLTTLRLYLDMLATGMVRDEAQKSEYIQTLNLEADRLNRLVGNVLDFSRLENQRPRLVKAPVTLGDLLSQLQETWQGRCRNADKELVIVNDVPTELVLLTDVQMVNQILGNLIDNACKYSQGAEDPHIWVRARADGQRQLLVEVEDRGQGVPPRERRLIFRPFRRGRSDQVSAGGVGLGLALAKQWANLLGGKLSLGSAEGKVGACFRLELPLVLT